MNGAARARRWQSLRYGSIFLGAALLIAAGCGGGDGSGNSDGSGLNINQPTTLSGYQTDQDVIALEGTSSIPSGSICNGEMFGTIAPGFTIDWENAANAATGTVFSPILICLGEPRIDWSTSNIPIEPGENRITVSASTLLGVMAQDSITVTRVPDVTPPTVTIVNPVQSGSSLVSIWITFSEPVDLATAQNGNLTVINATTAQPITGIASVLSTHSPTIIYQFADSQALGTIFHLHLENITDLAGTPLAAPFDATFSESLYF